MRGSEMRLMQTPQWQSCREYLPTKVFQQCANRTMAIISIRARQGDVIYQQDVNIPDHEVNNY